jgi:hypothetical protein
MVTREKHSPTAAHAGHKGYQYGYLVPGGIAGPLCLRRYKYGGLALQDGGWARGWLPETVKMLTIRRLNLWPLNSRTEWSQPKQWKRINEMRIAHYTEHEQ